MNIFEVVVKKGGIIKTIPAREGDNLAAVLNNGGVYIQSPCGGQGTCGKCKAVFIKGPAAISAADRRHLSADELSRGTRLTCGVHIHEQIEIEVPADSGGMEILTAGGGEATVSVKQQISKKHLVLALPSIHDQRSDLRRLQDGLGMDMLIARKQLLGEIPDTLRRNNFNVTAAVYNNELIGLEGGDTSQKAYGVAIDIGTTTVVCYLADLGTGELIDTESEVNSQIPYGADVISRINFTAARKDGLRILQGAVIRQLSAMITVLAERNNIPLKNVYHAVVAGNTTMTHLFLGVPCAGIALSPYIPVVTDLAEFTGKETDLPINGYVTVLPGVSGYIGSDITAGILAVGMNKMAGYSLLIDLGTNGEMALGNKDGIISCSTAAGPAFEGAKIKCGIGGVRGAIAKVDLRGEKIFDTIGDAEPVGICGSGVLDMVSELLKYGIADSTGRMTDPAALFLPPELAGRILNTPDGKQFIIHDNIVFTQMDIREVQLAKAAVSAGITMLLQEAGIGYKDLEQVFIAGGFGNYMSVESALNTGILPRSTAEIIKSVGNSAGAGARMCLLSKRHTEEIRAISRLTRYIELSGRPDFEEHFVEAMGFSQQDNRQGG